jgi:hypothetical protein
MSNLPARDMYPPAQPEAPRCPTCDEPMTIGTDMTGEKYADCQNVTCPDCALREEVIIDQLRDMVDTLGNQRDIARRDVIREGMEAKRLKMLAKELERLYLAEKREHNVTLRLLAAKTTQPENAVTVAEWEEQYNVQQKRACDAEAEVKRLTTELSRIANMKGRGVITSVNMVAIASAALDGAK